MGIRRLSTTALLRYSLFASLGLLGAACGSSVDPGECSSSHVDSSTQLTVCDEGYSHRATTTQCEPVAGTSPPRERCSDEDCSTLPNGYCATSFASGETCRSGCVVDSDCGEGELCACGHAESPTGGVCVAANCRTDDDCGDGNCALSWQFCGEPIFVCQSADDECDGEGDCAGGGCVFDGSKRACSTAVCGRPFLVLAEPRLPPVAERADWSLAASPRVEHLTPAERAESAAHWVKLGRMEHASIAAFARFSLQLLSLGAPPHLVEQCTQALADETAHARLCFGIASAYAGRALGPGPLDVGGSLDTTSLMDIVDLVIVEGCFGETNAALEALDAAEGATDPVISAAYAQIARDEQRHAELAFRFIGWALERGGWQVAERVAAALVSEHAQSAPAQAVSVPCLQALLENRRAA